MGSNTERSISEKQDGYVLVISLLILVLLTLTAVYAAYQSSAEMRVAANYKASRQAFYAAEAGITDSHMRLSSIVPSEPPYDANWRAFIGCAKDIAALFPDEPDYSNIVAPLQNQIQYSVRIRHKTVLDYGANLDKDADLTDIVLWADTDGDGNPEQNVKAGWPVEIITSIGSIGPGTSSAHKRITVELVRLSSSPFIFAVFGNDSVRITGNGSVDSYISSSGPYSSTTAGDDGHVATNSTASGAIDLTGNSTIYGDASVGVGGNPVTGITAKKTDQVKGIKGALSKAHDVTPLDDPGGGTSASLNMSGDTSKTFTSGEYRLPSIDLSGNADAYISGNVTFYVPGTISISGNAAIRIGPNGSLKIYSAGTISIGGNGFINEGNLPDRLLIYGTETCTSVHSSGNGDLYGGIYAPNAAVSIGGNGEIYGSVIGGSLEITGNGSVHYDKKLAGIPVKPAEFNILTWREE